MAQHIHLLQILHHFLLSSAEDMVQISKETLADLSQHLQQKNETIELIQLESQLKRNELQEKGDAFESLNHTAKYDSKSFIQTASSIKVVQVQLSSKPIIKPWEEIQSNRN